MKTRRQTERTGAPCLVLPAVIPRALLRIALLALLALSLGAPPPAPIAPPSPDPHPASAPLTAADRAKRANVPAGEWVLVSIHQKSLTLYRGTEVVKRYAVATGAGNTPTPIGTFYISNRFSGDLGGFGTRFLGLNVPWGRFGIHGTNKPHSIGSNASHGCIRMFIRDSEELYGLVPNGAKVVIEGGAYGLLDTGLRRLVAGDRMSHVAAVQARLAVLGYYYGWPDGVFGAGTARAVAAARKALGLPHGEHVDTAFYNAIGLILFE